MILSRHSSHRFENRIASTQGPAGLRLVVGQVSHTVPVPSLSVCLGLSNLGACSVSLFESLVSYSSVHFILLKQGVSG